MRKMETFDRETGDIRWNSFNNGGQAKLSLHVDNPSRHGTAQDDPLTRRGTRDGNRNTEVDVLPAKENYVIAQSNFW